MGTEGVWVRGLTTLLGVGLLACTPVSLDDLSALPATTSPGTPEPTPASSMPPTQVEEPTATPSPTPTVAPSTVDRDEDGYTEDTDCNDRNPNMYPGAVELCDGLDNDCDQATDEDLPEVQSWPDLDDDGYGNGEIPSFSCSVPPTNVTQVGDCDDTDPNINPNGIEVCNGEDDDCDGKIDEIAVLVWPDNDGDGFGDLNSEPELLCDPVGNYASLAFDCNDTDASIAPVLVSTQGTPEGTGSPLNPYGSLAPAISTPNGCMQVLVAPGTYIESVSVTPSEGMTVEALASDKESIFTAPSGQGVLWLTGANNVHLVGLVFQGAGSVGRAGACLRLEDSSAVTLERLTVRSCSTSGSFNGGGVAILDSQDIQIRDSVFSLNKAQNGGAVFVDTSSVTVSTSLLESNSARYAGGAVFVDSSTSSWSAAGVALERVLAEDNSAFDSGGAAAANEYARLEAIDSEFHRNTTSDRFGGAMTNPSKVLRSIFIENRCLGGGNYAVGGALTLRQNAEVLNSIFVADDALFAGAINLYELENATGGEPVHVVNQNTFVDHNARSNLTPGDTFYAYNGRELTFVNNLIVNLNEKNTVAFQFLDLMTYHVDYTYFSLDSGSPFGGTNWQSNAGYYLQMNPGTTPIFMDYTPGAYYNADFHLAPGCPAINGGDPTMPRDPDGSLPDVGAFGGPEAAFWD